MNVSRKIVNGKLEDIEGRISYVIFLDSDNKKDFKINVKVLLQHNTYSETLEESRGTFEIRNNKYIYVRDEIIKEDKNGIADNAMSVITDGIEVYIPFEELVDKEEERKRLLQEKKKVLAEIEKSTKILTNPGFAEKAPPARVEAEWTKLPKFDEILKSIEE